MSFKIKEIFKELSCEDISFNPVIAFGKNASNPHHTPTNTKPKIGDCVLVDIGAQKNNYSADMTRTFFIKEVPDLACRNFIEQMGYGKYFIHRTGHCVGLENHEND